MNVTFSSPYRMTPRFGGNQKDLLKKLRQNASLSGSVDALKRDERIAALDKLSVEEIMEQMISPRPDQSFSTGASRLILDKLKGKEFNAQTRNQAKQGLMTLRQKLEATRSPKTAASVPDFLVTGLIEGMGVDPIDARDLDHYKGPVFTPAGEEAFMRHVMNTTLSAPFLVDLLDYEMTHDRSDSSECLQAQFKLADMAKNGCTPYSLSKEQAQFNHSPASTLADLLEQKGFFQDDKEVPPFLMNAIKDNFS